VYRQEKVSVEDPTATHPIWSRTEVHFGLVPGVLGRDRMSGAWYSTRPLAQCQLKRNWMADRRDIGEVDCSETEIQGLDRESHTSCQRHECRLGAPFDSTSVFIVASVHYGGEAICPKKFLVSFHRVPAAETGLLSIDSKFLINVDAPDELASP
jgi:hypothetical protein